MNEITTFSPDDGAIEMHQTVRDDETPTGSAVVSLMDAIAGGMLGTFIYFVFVPSGQALLAQIVNMLK
ncbi:hypothetical protein CCP3SC15_2440007 [Gammaproteobacteria bacterium]